MDSGLRGAVHRGEEGVAGFIATGARGLVSSHYCGPRSRELHLDARKPLTLHALLPTSRLLPPTRSHLLKVLKPLLTVGTTS